MRKAIELFAGVGGFRLGLERSGWDVVWSNQWEPSTKKQHASEVYTRHFGSEGHVNMDIADVDANDIPDHSLLAAGFPCQDYSVARTLGDAAGLAGKKGILWWDIHRVLMAKRPRFVLLENVDRLLSSPAKQRTGLPHDPDHPDGARLLSGVASDRPFGVWVPTEEEEAVHGGRPAAPGG